MMSRRAFCGGTAATLVAAGCYRWPVQSDASLKVAFVDIDTPGARAFFERYVTECRRLAPETADRTHYEFHGIDPDAADARRRLDDLIAELRRQRATLAIASSSFVARAFAEAGPPIDTLFHTVESWTIAAAHNPSPIGNPRMTGFLSGIPLSEKRIELLEDTVPRLRRIGFLVDEKLLSETDDAGRLHKSASDRGIDVLTLNAASLPGVERALARQRHEVDAYVVPRLILTIREASRLCATVNATRRPSIFAQSRMVREGGLMSYEAAIEDAVDTFARQTVALLGGTPIARLPIEYPRHYRLSVNLATAATIGFDMPVRILRRASLVLR